MEKKSIHNTSPTKQLLDKLERVKTEGILSEKYYHIFLNFYYSYQKAVLSSNKDEDAVKIFDTLLELILKQLHHPHIFSHYHKKIRSPFDYYQYGLDFLRPLVDFDNSTITGMDQLQKMQDYINKGENVILFANHQIEGDPQVLGVMLSENFPKLCDNLIFVAGERVIVDAIAVPLSLGCDLLCIYSKKYLNLQPEVKSERQLHNKKTMEVMRQLLHKGGKVIYVAPSGGRDRPNSQGTVEVAPFDHQSLEMFYLMAKRAGTTTHFFPLALSTYDILPPPNALQKEMGEMRSTQYAPVHIGFGEEIDMEHFPHSDAKDKLEKRKNRANYIYNLVKAEYQKIIPN
jgi:glycerol-3-phosphate O-acyltransferase